MGTRVLLQVALGDVLAVAGEVGVDRHVEETALAGRDDGRHAGAFWIAIRNADIASQSSVPVRVWLRDQWKTAAWMDVTVGAPVAPPPITNIAFDSERRTLADVGYVGQSHFIEVPLDLEARDGLAVADLVQQVRAGLDGLDLVGRRRHAAGSLPLPLVPAGPPPAGGLSHFGRTTLPAAPSTTVSCLPGGGVTSIWLLISRAIVTP